MDVGGATHWSMDRVLSRREMLERLAAHYGPIEPIVESSSAPADRFRLPDGTVFGIISSTTEPFCHACDRSRLTADGLWYLCLYAPYGDRPAQGAARRRVGRGAGRVDPIHVAAPRGPRRRGAAGERRPPAADSAGSLEEGPAPRNAHAGRVGAQRLSSAQAVSLQQCSSNAAFRCEAMAMASRVSMSRRCIMNTSLPSLEDRDRRRRRRVRRQVLARALGRFDVGSREHRAEVMRFALVLQQRHGDAGAGLARGAAAHRVHDDHRRALLLDGGINGVRRLEVLKSEARQLGAHRRNERFRDNAARSFGSNSCQLFNKR